MQSDSLLIDTLNSVLDFIYPPVCLVCDTIVDEPDEPICQRCWDKIYTFDYIFCGNCEYPMSGNLSCSNCSPDNAIPIMALGRYRDPLGEIVRDFKYRGFRKIGRQLANRLIAAHRNSLNNMKFDCIVPIPLHSYRLKSRGYNQSLIIAEALGQHLNILVRTDILLKTVNNKYQKSLDPAHRDANVRNVYMADSTKVEGKKIMLVDDVITTGATLREARRVIEKAGGRVILAATIAAAG